jgi:hypothetical protein
VLQQLLSNDPMSAWGWLVPFVAGAVTGLGVMILRRGMDESELGTEKGPSGRYQWCGRPIAMLGHTVGLQAALLGAPTLPGPWLANY